MGTYVGSATVFQHSGDAAERVCHNPRSSRMVVRQAQGRSRREAVPILISLKPEAKQKAG